MSLQTFRFPVGGARKVDRQNDAGRFCTLCYYRSQPTSGWRWYHARGETFGSLSQFRILKDIP